MTERRKAIVAWFIALAGAAGIALAAFCGGCGTPAGYNSDLTPGTNGEGWRGGEAAP